MLLFRLSAQYLNLKNHLNSLNFHKYFVMDMIRIERTPNTDSESPKDSLMR